MYTSDMVDDDPTMESSKIATNSKPPQEESRDAAQVCPTDWFLCPVAFGGGCCYDGTECTEDGSCKPILSSEHSSTVTDESSTASIPESEASSMPWTTDDWTSSTIDTLGPHPSSTAAQTTTAAETSSEVTQIPTATQFSSAFTSSLTGCQGWEGYMDCAESVGGLWRCLNSRSWATQPLILTNRREQATAALLATNATLGRPFNVF
jgi:hypothetical protein